LNENEKADFAATKMIERNFNDSDEKWAKFVKLNDRKRSYSQQKIKYIELFQIFLFLSFCTFQINKLQYKVLMIVLLLFIIDN